MDRQHDIERIDRQFQGLLDAETGMPTTALLRDCVDSAILRAHRVGKSVLVAWIELKIPDAVESRAFVGAVVERFRSSLRIDDTIARVATRELVVVCNDLPGAEAVPGIIERLVKTKHRPLMVVGHDARLISRIGVVLDEGSRDPQRLLERAHAAMLADEQGRRIDVRLIDMTRRRQIDTRTAGRESRLNRHWN